MSASVPAGLAVSVRGRSPGYPPPPGPWLLIGFVACRWPGVDLPTRVPDVKEMFLQMRGDP